MTTKAAHIPLAYSHRACHLAWSARRRARIDHCYWRDRLWWRRDRFDVQLYSCLPPRGLYPQWYTVTIVGLAIQINKICVVVDICDESFLGLLMTMIKATGPCHCIKALVLPKNFSRIRLVSKVALIKQTAYMCNFGADWNISLQKTCWSHAGNSRNRQSH